MLKVDRIVLLCDLVYLLCLWTLNGGQSGENIIFTKLWLHVSISSSNTILIIFVVSQRNDDKRIVFFPLQSTLRKPCFIKFSMPGNLQDLIVELKYSGVKLTEWDMMVAKNNDTVYSRFISTYKGMLQKS